MSYLYDATEHIREESKDYRKSCHKLGGEFVYIEFHGNVCINDLIKDN